MQDLMIFFKEFNIQNILSMAIIMWYFTRDINSQIHELDDDLKIMNRDIHIMNTRVSRMEGTVYGKDMYNQIKE